ncbi:MAG: exosortase A-associated hydrolase 2 [Halioglobus sp.]|jgi:exosortase A-associated hydrolase 2
MNSEKCSIRADFLTHSERKLFYLLLEPTQGAAHSAILFLHPFADEMHKSRHIVSSQARALAAAGHTVMLLDLPGCGDSGGEFVDANWQVWREGASFALNFLADKAGVPVVLWGLRLGGLLACDLSQSNSAVDRLLLWQPVLNGEQQIDQFLRLHSGAAFLGEGRSFDRKSLWRSLREGQSLEVAGYELSSSMALEMSRARLNELRPGCPVSWIEIGNGPSSGPALASESVMSRWRAQGVGVAMTQVQGEPFWRSIDARVNLRLQQATVDILAEHV